MIELLDAGRVADFVAQQLAATELLPPPGKPSILSWERLRKTVVLLQRHPVGVRQLYRTVRAFKEAYGIFPVSSSPAHTAGFFWLNFVFYAFASWPAGPEGQCGQWAMDGFFTAVSIHSRIPEAKRDEALELLDYLCSPEGLELLRYGLEGVHWAE